MYAETRWALPGRLSKPSGACPSPVQVPEIYGWSDFLITVSPSACWPLALPSHLSPSPACSCPLLPAPPGKEHPFLPIAPAARLRCSPFSLRVPSSSSSRVGQSDLLKYSLARLNPNWGVAQVLHQTLLRPTHLPTKPLHSAAASHRQRFPCTS